MTICFSFPTPLGMYKKKSLGKKTNPVSICSCLYADASDTGYFLDSFEGLMTGVPHLLSLPHSTSCRRECMSEWVWQQERAIAGTCQQKQTPFTLGQHAPPLECVERWVQEPVNLFSVGRSKLYVGPVQGSRGDKCNHRQREDPECVAPICRRVVLMSFQLSAKRRPIVGSSFFFCRQVVPTSVQLSQWRESPQHVAPFFSQVVSTSMWV